MNRPAFEIQRTKKRIGDVIMTSTGYYKITRRGHIPFGHANAELRKQA